MQNFILLFLVSGDNILIGEDACDGVKNVCLEVGK